MDGVWVQTTNVFADSVLVGIDQFSHLLYLLYRRRFQFPWGQVFC